MIEAPFRAHHSLLFTVAYEMLGSATDAEDVVHETRLRWAELDSAARESVEDPRAYLLRTVTRACLDRLRALTRRRRDYVGTWLPEPLLTSPDVAEDSELAENMSFATLTVLESLHPTERAVFVLREVFRTPYDEIAAAVDRTPAAVRQIARRARDHVDARRPRTRASRAEQQALVERFLTALRDGDLWALLDVLAPEVVAVADGGGIVTAFHHPIEGVGLVARLLVRPADRNGTFEPVWLNGAPAVRHNLDGVPHGALVPDIEDGRITRIYAVRNPHKLSRLDEEAPISR
ncbi:RNA polymerase sigma factor SigJ [Streptomyces sp. TRM68416]|uniref:RNA polymerase sigma factor SigJ n=1 Tax=Streptomyces sp. TRM68416 TaxID=2758412 RepID=UPI0016620ED1|nr:RNA polymerase sigma factor SigJ [Streptomyces sp. TRM68416]MBD0841529.1 RNA polymerase sigma factor SigJ [Streptomyces sp. TRM68416]